MSMTVFAESGKRTRDGPEARAGDCRITFPEGKMNERAVALVTT